MDIMFKLLMASCLCSSIWAQTFELPKEKAPFMAVLDWRGEGAIFMSKDIKSATNQTLLTFVGNEPRSKWQETIIPKSEKPFYLASDGAKYVYFMDEIELNNGKFTFYQLNNAGNVKPTSCSYSVAFKKLGYDINDLKLLDVQVTDKALMHLFEFYDKTTKATVLLAGLMTHNNFLAYACEVGRWQEEENEIHYAGFHDDKIAFYAKSERNKKSGMEVWFLSAKGLKQDAQFIELPTLNGFFELTEQGTCGAMELKNSAKKCAFIASFQGGKWTLLTVDNGLQSAVYHDKSWVKRGNSSKLQPSKNIYQIGLYRMNDGFLLGQNSTMAFVSTNSNVKSGSYSSKGCFNSSKSYFTDKKDLVFDVDGHFLFFDETQLGKEISLNLELTEK
jgi:hypothetical protein